MSMLNKTSKWKMISADGVLNVDSRNPYSQIVNEFGIGQPGADQVETDNARKSPDQEHADKSIAGALRSTIETFEREGLNPRDQENMEILAGIVQRIFGGDMNEAMIKVKEALDIPTEGARASEQMPEAPNLNDQSQNIPMENVMPPTTGLGETAPSMQNQASLDRIAKYKGKYKKNKTKQHLKGKGPKAEKANEIYHAIMREKGKDEPTKEEQASAAAIAWSQAEKTMKKKAYFRGEEAKILDSYRGMWGEELVRISVNETIVDVPRETIEFVSTEVIDPVVELKKFVSAIPEDANTKPEILANIHNLKTAKDIAYQLITSNEEDLSSTDEIAIDVIYSSCDNRISNLEYHLANFIDDQDEEYVESLPKYEVGKEIFASSFSREGDCWMDEVIEKMAADAEGIDIDKLANEDPLIFVAGLSEEVIANAPAVQSMAMDRVLEAAGPLDEETKNYVVSTYIEKAESARRKALANMKQIASETVQNQQKTANSVPDEGLFL